MGKAFNRFCGFPMRYVVSLFTMVAVCMGAAAAKAEPSCTPTARVATQNYPGAAAVVTSNNLMLPAGKAVEANGQKIVIQGRVLDSRCAPVQEAVVELWQNSPTGRWLLAGREDLATPNAVFAGAGRTYTDSDGRFSFITAFPAPLKYQVRRDKRTYTVTRAPFVNIKVIPQNQPTLNTALFFSDDVRNDKDEIYRKLSSKARNDVTVRMKQDDEGELVGDIELVIAGKAPYRTY